MLADPAELASALETAGFSAYRQRRLSEADALLSESVRIGEQATGSPDGDNLRRRTYLGEVQAQLRIDAAEATLRNALATSLRLHGAAWLDTTQVRLRLGYVLAGVLESAAKPDEFTLPYAYHNLRTILHDKGRLDEAAATLRRALELRDRTRPGTSMAAEIRVALATALFDAGQAGETQQLMASAEEIFRTNGAGPGNRACEPWVVGRLRLAQTQGNLAEQRLRLDEHAAMVGSEEAVSRGALASALLGARVALDDGRPVDALPLL